MTKAQSLRADFERAVTCLDEALALPKDPIVQDSAIHRFEISFELCWKFLQAFFEEQHNAVCTSPRTYNEDLAKYVYSRLAETARRFRAVLATAAIEPE